MATPSREDSPDILRDQRIVFIGKLGGMTKREAQNLVRSYGAQVLDQLGTDADLVVIGADELPLQEASLLDESIRRRAAEGKLEIISETQLWERLGLFEDDTGVRLYTPAMLAELIGVPVSTIRRWHRRRLIVPVREVHRLPYFDFQEVATARQLAELLLAGASARAIEQQLAELSRYVPEVERPLAQLSVIVEGKRLLLRQGEGLVEPGGQLRIDFDALDEQGDASIAEHARAVTLPLIDDNVVSSDWRELLVSAERLEDEGHLDAAVELYRAVLAATGPHAEVCFQLAELLYRLGDVSGARERYYMAVELDEDYVEARANLGCVLAETGQQELAVAAFRGALRYHRDYPDAHYHLARALDELGRPEEAEEHWREFLLLAPTSPWSQEARQRLENRP